VIFSRSATLADAVATATANRIRTKDDLAPALDFARAIKGVSGCLAIIGNNFAVSGKIELL
jgi:ApbE superfamily uncharacterized protein (UPF0280 family)